MSSVNQQPAGFAHLPRPDCDKTFCGLPLLEGTILSSTIEAADCDTCIKAALAEGAPIVDRREQAKSIGQILEHLGLIPTIRIEKAMDSPDTSVCEQFPIELAELKDVPEHLVGKMYLDLPAHVLSKEGWFPTPATCLLSMLSFYLDVLRMSVAQETIQPEQGKARVAQVERLIAFCKQERAADATSYESEYAVTVDQWPEDLRK